MQMCFWILFLLNITLPELMHLVVFVKPAHGISGIVLDKFVICSDSSDGVMGAA